MSYYSELVRISILATIGILVYLFDCEQISRKRKIALTIIGILIIINVSCESAGFLFNGKKHYLMLHGIIKAIEFSLAPIIPIMFAWVLAPSGFSPKKRIAISIGLLINATLEFLSVIIPFTFYIDSDNIYFRGSYYWIYIMTYILGIIYLVYELRLFAIRFQSRNMATLVYMLFFAIYGFCIRLRNYELYTDWLIVTISYIMFVLVYNDISLKVDPLTFLLNRKAFETRKKRANYPTVVFMLDLNDFKSINDNYGHDLGDEALRTVSKLIRQVFSNVACCFRYGGDEFSVILKPNKLKQLAENTTESSLDSAIQNLINHLHKLIEKENEKQREKEKEIRKYHLLKNGISVGYALFDPNKEYTHIPYAFTSFEEALKGADEMMYEMKESHAENKN